MKNPFEYQQPTPEQIKAIEHVREALKAAWDTINAVVPVSPERTLAVRKLEEASMWANKSIVFDGERYMP